MGSAVLVALLTVVFVGGLGALALADRAGAGRIAHGVAIGSIDVGGLTKAQALQRLERRIGSPSRRPVTVRVGGRVVKLTARRAGVRLDVALAVDRALSAGRGGNFLGRGWRQITGGAVRASEPVHVSVNRGSVRSFVGGLARDVARPATDAQIAINIDSVAVMPAKDGRRLTGTTTLERRIARAFTVRHTARTLSASTAPVHPAVTESSIWSRTPTVVTVAHDARRVRVFQRGKVVKQYTVAVGDPQFPTPRGRFAVQSKQKNPAWNVPTSAWAGSLAGKTIPGGAPTNPLVARWIGFSGSVGFHGTREAASLGQAASHGCVRMAPSDVIDLFDRVQVGTPVLVG